MTRFSTFFIGFLSALLFVSCADDALRFSPDPALTSVFSLTNEMKECSGAAIIDGALWLHNDSGDDPTLYNLDRVTGEIIARRHLKDVDNRDWEDMTVDTENGYVGDFGNNRGRRTDLEIIKYPLSYMSLDSIMDVEHICFELADQTNFSGDDRLHNFDTEAMIIIDEELHLFSKNRAAAEAKVYRIPAVAGNYSVLPTGFIQADGMVTAADYNPETHRLALLGYNDKSFPYEPFVWIIEDYTAPDFLTGKQTRYDLPISEKAEAVVWEDERTLLIGTEAGGEAGAHVFRLKF